MGSGNKNTFSEGVNAFLFLALLACAAYVGYLHFTEKELAFHEYLLTTGYFWKPVFVVEWVADGGWRSHHRSLYGFRGE